MEPEQRQRVLDLIRDHHVISVREAHQMGITAKMIARAVQRSELEMVRRRVYRSPAAVRSWTAELAADLAACLAPAWAARDAALALHGALPRWMPAVRHLVVIGTGRPTVQGEVRVHRTAFLPEIDQTVVDEVPSTTVARAVIDLAGSLTPWQRMQLVDHVIMEEHVERAALYDRAAALSRGRRGVGQICRLTEPGAEVAYKSRLEKLGLPLLIEAGVRDPKVNVIPAMAPAAGLTDVVSELDRMVVDWDGMQFHRLTGARQRDNEKGNAAALGGYTTLRFTWFDVTKRPARVVAITRRALGRAA